MKKIITGVLIPILVISFVGLNSCKQRAAKKEAKQEEKEKIQEFDSTIEKNVYPLPTSAEVIRMLTELEVGYIIGISNPPENTKKYFTSIKRAMNLGVFGADLSYATLYKKNQEVLNYLDASRSLINELNMSKIYDQELYNKINQNIDARDELVNILTNYFNDTYAYLSDNEQQNLALLIVGGAWVEAMYLTTHVSEAAYQVAGISRVLLEQKKSFDQYMEITQPFMNDPIVSDFVKSLDPIKKVYEGLTTSLTDKNIMDITNAIAEIRAKVVE